MNGSTMDFFGHQDAARRASKKLVWLFGVTVAGIVVAIYLVAAFATRGHDGHGLWNPSLLVAIAAAVLAVVGTASAIKTAQLNAGGPAVARMLGGREIDPSTREPLEQRLHNVVEEMAIASGVPVPRVYVLDDEQGINAFAAGWSTRDAAVAVTRGALETFDRDALQGVIAHEMSHVFHGDMRLNLRMIGTLFGITCIATIGELLFRSLRHVRTRGNDKNPAAAIAMAGLALMVVGGLGSFLAGLIRAAVSRQREYLADASAVAYTRNPRGLGKALWQIRSGSARIGSGNARDASHMFFADAVSHWTGPLGATHPPLEQRIDRVLPGFLAAAKKDRVDLFFEETRTEATERTPSEATTRSGKPQVAAAAAFAGIVGVAAAAIPGRVGTVTKDDVDAARALLASLPLEVAAAAHSPQEAPALVHALLLHEGQAQDAALAKLDPSLAHRARELAGALRSLDTTSRFPLAALCVPALRAVPAEARAALHQSLRALATADGSVTPFEMALLHLVERNAPTNPGQGVGPKGSLPLVSAQAEVRLALSLMAHSGSDPAAAFAHGFEKLAGQPPMQLVPREAIRYADVEAAMTRLERLSPAGKRLLVEAVAAAAGADGQIAAAEGELLRAFAACWDCPLPPMWLGRPA